MAVNYLGIYFIALTPERNVIKLFIFAAADNKISNCVCP